MAPQQTVAQAQVQAQHTISHTESLELVRCLLRVSVYHMSALRGLFPEEFFKEVSMKNLDGMAIKILEPKDDESKRLMEWVEHGVYDAVKQGYLKTLMFGIAKDVEGTELLEEYVYNFEYGNDGLLQMMDMHHIKTAKQQQAGKVNVAPKVTIKSVRYQVIRLLRMLVQLCHTLDKVPDERFLFCRLVYHENTPADYEPEFFRSIDPSEPLGHFGRKPFTMSLGNVGTDHHQVTMRIKSVLDPCDDADDEDCMDLVSGQPSDTEDLPDQDDPARDGTEMPAHKAACADAPKQVTPADPTYDAVKQFCLTTAASGTALMSVEQLKAHFQQMNLFSAQSMLQRLHHEGILQPAREMPGVFSVVDAGKGTCPDKGANALASHLGGLHVGEAQMTRLAAPAALVITEDNHDHNAASVGSDVTEPSGGSQRNKRALGGAAAKGSQEEVAQPNASPRLLHHASQHSRPSGVQAADKPAKACKMSYVAEPIHQGAKRAKKGVASKGTPAMTRSRLNRMQR